MIKGTAIPQSNHIPWLDISEPRYWVAVMCVNPGKASRSAPSTLNRLTSMDTVRQSGCRGGLADP